MSERSVRRPRRRMPARWRTTATTPVFIRELWRGPDHLATIEVMKSFALWRVEIGEMPSGRGQMTLAEAEETAKTAAIHEESHHE